MKWLQIKQANLAIKFLFVACCGLPLWELLHLLTAPLSVIIQYLPDDTFYYLEISRNLAKLGLSTFDGGQTLTNGYHVLWAWILELVSIVVNFDRMLLLRGAILISALLAFGTVLTVARYAWKNSLPLLTALTLLITSQSFLNNSISGLEWSLTITISTATLFALLYVSSKEFNFLLMLALCSLGVVGSLSRSDFPGQTFSYFLSALIIFLWKKDRRFLLPASFSFFGSGLGLGITLWRNWLLTGHTAQDAARMKLIWASAGGRTPLAFFSMLIRTVSNIPVSRMHRYRVHKITQEIEEFHPLGGHALQYKFQPLLITNISLLLLFTFFVWLLLCIAFQVGQKSKFHEIKPNYLFLGISAAFTLLFYASSDTLIGFSVSTWYSSQVTVAVGILIYLILLSAMNNGRTVLAYCVFAFIIFLNTVLFIAKPSYNDIPDSNSNVVMDIKAIRQQLGNARIGIPDAGLINFVYGGSIINLDGLVNDEIVNYVPNRLPCYLLDKNIIYFSGFGGSANRFFNLGSETDYSTKIPLYLSNGKKIYIYKVDPVRLRALKICSGDKH